MSFLQPDLSRYRSEVQTYLQDINNENFDNKLEGIERCIFKSNSIVLNQSMLSDLKLRAKTLHCEENEHYQKIIARATDIFGEEKKRLLEQITPFLQKDDGQGLEKFLRDNKGINFFTTVDPSMEESFVLEVILDQLQEPRGDNPPLIKVCKYVVDTTSRMWVNRKIPDEQAKIIFGYLRNCCDEGDAAASLCILSMITLLTATDGLQEFKSDKTFWDHLFTQHLDLMKGNEGSLYVLEALKGGLETVAKSLVDAGVDLNKPVLITEYSRTESKNLWTVLNFKLEPMIWLVKNGFDIQQCRPVLNYYFQRANISGPEAWDHCWHMLKLGVAVPEDLQAALITAALTPDKSEKPTMKPEVVKLLLERTGPGKEIALDKWGSLHLLWNHPEAQVSEILTKLIDEGFDIVNARTPQGETFLYKAFDMGYNDTVLTLMMKVPALLEVQESHLETLCARKGTSLTSLKTLLEGGKKSRSVVEIAAREKTTMKNVCNLIGDQHLRGLFDLTGVRVEGAHQHDTMPYLASLCRLLVEKYPEGHPERISADTAKELLKLADELDVAAEIGDLKPAVFSVATVRSKVSEITGRLRNLQVGERILVPSGWSSTYEGGHTMMMEYTLLENGNYLLSVYNAGGGIDKHDLTYVGSRRYVNTKRVYEIPAQEVLNESFIQALLEPLFITENVPLERGPRGEFDIYPLLEPYTVSSVGKLSQKDLSFWGRPQESGTCSIAASLACMGARLGRENFTKIKPLLENVALELSVDKFGPLLGKDAPFRKVLQRVAPKMFQRVAKEFHLAGDISQDDLEEKTRLIEEMKKTADAVAGLSKPAISQTLPFPAPTGYEPIMMEYKYVPQAIKPTEETSLRKQPLNPAYAGKIKEIPTFEGVNSYEELLEVIKGLNEFIDPSMALRTINSTTELGRLLLAEPKPKWFLELKKDKENGEKVLSELLETLDLWSQRIASSVEGLPGNSLQVEIALSYALGMTWECAVALDDLNGVEGDRRFDAYGIPVMHILKLVEPSRRYGLFGPGSKPVFEDCEILKLFFRKIYDKAGKSYHPLWDVKTSMTNQYVGEKAGEYGFYKAQLGQLETNDRNRFLNNRKIEVDNFNRALPISPSGIRAKPVLLENVDEERWLVHSVGAEDLTVLPPRVSLLRKAVMRSQLIDPLQTQPEKLTRVDFNRVVKLPTIDPNSVHYITYDVSKPIVDLTLEQTRRKYDSTIDLTRAVPSQESVESSFFKPTSQNEILLTSYHSDFFSALLAASLETDLQFSLIEDFLENHPEQLEFSTNRLAMFSAFLRRPSRIVQSAEMDQFFRRVIDFYQDRKDLNLSADLAKEVLVFLHDLRMRLILLDLGNAEEARKELRVMIQENEEPAYKQALLDTLIHSYANREDLSFDESVELYTSYAWMKTFSSSIAFPLGFPQAIGEREGVFSKHLRKFTVSFFEDEERAKVFGDKLLSKLGVNYELIQKVDLSRFPVMKFELTSSGNYAEFDLISGEFRLNGSKLLVLDETKVQMLLDHFENPRALVLTGEGNVYEGRDKVSKFRLTVYSSGYIMVDRQFTFSDKERWYRTFSIPDGFTLNINDVFGQQRFEARLALDRIIDQEFPMDVHHKFQYWWLMESKEEEYRSDEVKLLALKKRSSECVYTMTGEQKFTFPFTDQPLQRCHIKDLLTHFLFSRIHPGFELWSSTLPNSDYHLLRYPYLKDEQGNEIEFEWKDSRWVWRQNPHLFVSEDQSFEGIEGLSRFIVLENSLGKREVLLPSLSNEEHLKVVKPGDEMTIQVNQGQKVVFDWKLTEVTPGKFELKWVNREDPRFFIRDISGSELILKSARGEHLNYFIGHEQNKAALSESLHGGPIPDFQQLVMNDIKDFDGNPCPFEWKRVRINDSQKDYRWVLRSNPEYYLKPNQQFDGKGSTQMLALTTIYKPKDNPEGDYFTEVSIPRKEKQAIADKISNGPSRKNQEILSCLQIGIQDESLSTKQVLKNLYIAYLSFERAVGPKDLHRVAEYLQNAHKFERYTDDELKFLGLIFLRSRVDQSPDSIALGLYAHWLVLDNMKRNPQDRVPGEQKELAEAPGFELDSSEWPGFWNGEYVWKEVSAYGGFGASSKDVNLKSAIQEHCRRYKANKNLVQHDLKLELLLDLQELNDLNLLIDSPSMHWLKVAVPIYKTELSKKEIETFKAKGSRGGLKLQSNREISRSVGLMPDYFWNFYLNAKSPNPQNRAIVEDFIKYISGERTALMVILEAALISTGDKDHPLYSSAKHCIQQVDELFTQARRDVEQSLQPLINGFAQGLTTYYEGLAQERRGPPAAFPKKERVSFSTEPPPIELPQEPPPITTVRFKPIPGTETEFGSLFDEFFTRKESSSVEGFEPLNLKTDDPLVIAGLEALNKDYSVGREKNLKVPVYVRKDQSVGKLIEKVSTEQKNDKEILEKIETQMLALARKPSDDPKIAAQEKAEILALQRNQVDLKDLTILFHMECEEEYRRMTHLNGSEEIAELHGLIGSYLLLKSRVERESQILTYAKNYVDSGNDGYLQLLARELEKKRVIDLSKDPAAFLVLESALDIVMRQDQLEGLRTMLPERTDRKISPPKVLIQRIQGGGKTLVWGHTLALLKADGYHLSVHIPATPQYRTALYDMAHHSKKMFGQKERTLVFDDRPEHVYDAYLNEMYYTLVRAINNREYVTIPKESLQAMRGKYIKMRKELLACTKSGDAVKADELRHTIALLGQSLGLLRDRGVFTIDEMHQGFNPRIELNLPTGPVTHPDALQSRLAADLLKFGMLAKDAEGFAILKLKENRQTELTAEERNLMLKAMKESLMDSPQWMKILGAVTEEKVEQLDQYISGKGPFPPYLEPVGSDKPSEAAQLAVLTKKFLSEGWLTDRLKLSVNEHHGITSDTNKQPISVPFLANMKEAKGSEFSDRTVMSVNTLIAYLQQGIPNQVLMRLIVDKQNEAVSLYEADRLKGILSSLENLEVCRKFHEATGLHLFDIEAEDEADIEKVQNGLKAVKAETIDFITDYVIQQVLSAVELHDTQVSSNGQNLGSMALSFNGYSGTFDNLNLTPLGATPHPDIGTDGQTVDLLIHQNDEIWVIDSAKEDAVITQLIEQHPDGDKIQALVDVGCHFRGMDNEGAARLFVNRMRKKKSKLNHLEGVLFFNSSDQLCFINKHQPNKVTVLTGTSKETIQIETGLPATKLFTFFGNSNIEGFDIAMGDEIKAVITVGEQNRKHQLFQGCRRLRKLQDMQRLVIAVKQGALDSIGASVGNDRIPLLPIGRVDPKQFSVKEVILHQHLNSQKDQLPDNLSIALQKMENLAQELVLDHLYHSSYEEGEGLFEKVETLFDKQVAVDFYAQYAKGMKQIDTGKYLSAFRDHLLNVMGTAFPDKVVEDLKKICDEQVIAPILKQVNTTIEVPATFEPGETALPSENQNSTQLQTRVAVQKQQAQRLQVSEQQQFNQELTLATWLTPALEHPLIPPQIMEPNFGQVTNAPANVRNIQVPNSSQIWSLNQLLTADSKELANCLSPDILVTSDFAITKNGGIDLYSKYRKEAYQILLIRDHDNGKTTTKVILLSVLDADAVRMTLTSMNKQPNRDMILMRPNGKFIASNDPYNRADPKLLEDPAVVRLLTQVNFFRGSTEDLSKEPFFSDFQRWMSEVDRGKYRLFFEEQILPSRRILPYNYHKTPIAEVLRGENKTGFGNVI